MVINLKKKLTPKAETRLLRSVFKAFDYFFIKIEHFRI